MVGELDQADSPKACRDRAILRFLFDMGLRRAEVVGLDVQELTWSGAVRTWLAKERPGRTVDDASQDV